jgi:hypothetical protein
MHATELPRPFHRLGWVYEEKYDGWRMVAEKVDSRVSFTSRNGLDHTRRFPELVKAVADLDAPSIVLDGEVAWSRAVAIVQPPEKDESEQDPPSLSLPEVSKKLGWISNENIPAKAVFDPSPQVPRSESTFGHLVCVGGWRKPSFYHHRKWWAKSGSWIAREAGSSWRSGISRSLPPTRANLMGSLRVRKFGSDFSSRTADN